MNKGYALLLILAVSLVTLMLRFLPFLFQKEEQRTPELIIYLGKVLPYAIMGMLVIFCFKNVSVISFPYAAPELISGALVVVLHIWKRNTLLSIIGGTACYMLLVQTIFA